MKNKYAGVTLDWYDDRGTTLKAVFPGPDKLPGIIKGADIRPLEKLGNEDFALIALDEGHVMRKYACHDPGTTAMSVIYFMEHGDKLPENAQKLAAANLARACVRFDMKPPEALKKAATGTIGGGGAVGNPEKESQKQAALYKAAVSPEWVKGTVARWAPKATREAILSGPAALRRHTTRLLSAAERHPYKAGAKSEALAKELTHQGFAAKGFRHPKELKAAREVLLARGYGTKTAADVLAGGKADEKTNSDFSKKQLEMGKKVEMEHTKSPQVAAEISRDHLEEFGDYYTRLDKMEEEAKMDKAANVVDITGERPTPKFKTASPTGPDDYAVILDGKGYYPIHSWDMVKKAEVYYQEEHKRMQPEVRRQYAVKLASKAAAMGYPLDPDILEAGSTGWAPQGHLKAAVEMRKIACSPHSEDRKFLDELFEKRASLEPPTYAEVLRRFDVGHGLDKGWDHIILDPWASTYGLNKSAEVVWEDGADRVTSEDLLRLSQNHAAFNREFTDEFRKEFQKDPVSIFESLPLPQKRVIARLASDLPYESESIAQ